MARLRKPIRTAVAWSLGLAWALAACGGVEGDDSTVDELFIATSDALVAQTSNASGLATPAPVPAVVSVVGTPRSAGTLVAGDSSPDPIPARPPDDPTRVTGRSDCDRSGDGSARTACVRSSGVVTGR